MAEQLNNVVLWDSTNAKMRTIDDSNDTLRWNVNTTIGGNLTVTGTTTTVHSETVLIQDNFLDLNYGNTTSASGEAGGLTVNYQATSTSTTATAFAASPPTITVTDSSPFSAGDIIQVYGSSDQAANDGLFIIASVAAGTIVCEGTGGDTVQEPFARNNFTAASGQSANIRKVNLSVLRANASGVWQIGTGATAPLTYENVQKGSDAANSLQQSYNAGATITTASSTDIAFTLTSGNFTASGAGSVNLTPTGASSFTSGGALTLTGGAASTWSTSSGALTLDGASGVSIEGNAGEVDITTTGQLDLNVGSVDLDSSGTIDIDGTVTSLNGSTAVSIGSNSKSMTNAAGVFSDSSMTSYAFNPSGAFSATPGGALSLTSSGAASLAGTTATIQSSSGDIDLQATSALAMTGASASLTTTGAFALQGSAASTVTAVSSNLTLQTAVSGDVDIVAIGEVDIDGASIDLTATGAFGISGSSDSTIQATNADLDLNSTGSGDVNISAGSELDLDGATVVMDSAGTMSIDSADTTNFTMTANSASDKTMTIKSTNSGSGDGKMVVESEGRMDFVGDGGLGFLSGFSAGAGTVNDGMAVLVCTKSESSGGANTHSGLFLVADTAGASETMLFQAKNTGSGGSGIAKFEAIGPNGSDNGKVWLTTQANNGTQGQNGSVVIDSKLVDINAAGALQMNSADDSNLTVTGSGKDLVIAVASGGAQKLQLDSAGTGSDAIDISASAGGVDIDASGALSLDGGSINIGTASDVAIDMDSSTLDIDASGAITMDSTSSITISGDTGATFGDDTEALAYDGSGNLDLDAVALDIDASAASSFNVTGAALELKTTTSGNIQLFAADMVENKCFISLNGKDATDLQAHNAKIGYTHVVSETVTEGQALYYGLAGSGQQLRVADASSIDTARFIGFAAEGITSGSAGNITTVQGSLAKVVFGSAPSADTSSGDMGKAVYLSETPGQVTLTPPSTDGSVVFQVGYLAYASGSTTGNLVHLHPQLIIENPA